MIYCTQKGGDSMYMDYTKLWKLLIDKNMSKTDLLELTGISSRILAKLSKNETVTTETLARICEALQCDVSDIMQCVREEQLSLYEHFKRSGKCTEEAEMYKTVRFTAGTQKYTVYLSQQSAVKATHILCGEDGTVYWEQLYPIGHLSSNRIRSVLIRPPRRADETAIVLIKGKPGLIAGLDENGFVSSRGVRKKDTDVYVMPEAAFKLFAPGAGKA